MANQNTATEEKEMDLQDLFDIVKRGFYSIVRLVFKAIDFFLKYWWVIMLLAIIGLALGHFTKRPTEYVSTLIVKTNYDSQAYVYNALEQFYDKLYEKDNEDFLKEIGLNPEDPEISNVYINPIIDVVELLSKMPNDRTLTAVIKEIELDEDETIFSSEEFYSNFDYHKLVVAVNTPDGEKFIKIMIDYINNQPQVKKVAQVSKANFEERVAINEASLKQIDDVIKIYTETLDFANSTAKQTGFYNNENSFSIRELFNTKKQITEENAELKDELTTMEGTLYVVSGSQFKEDGSFISVKSIIYAVLFAGSFVVVAFLRFCYVSLKEELAQMN